MKELPILFSTPMVQAILEGRKTQTRRIIKNQPPKEFNRHCWFHAPIYGFTPDPEPSDNWHKIKCRYGHKGDILWVRETWGVGSRPDPFLGNVDGIEFKSDGKYIDEIESLPLHFYDDFDYGNYDKSGWRPSIHMPKSISRIWLQVTDIKVERLQDISDEDAIAEGVKSAGCEDQFLCPSKLCINECVDKDSWWNYMAPDGEDFPCFTAKESFESLWRSINGPDSLQANPWVWVISFNVLSTTGKPD